MAAAEAARDIETVMSFWAEDAIFQTNGSKQLQGKEAIRAVMLGCLLFSFQKRSAFDPEQSSSET